MVLHHNLMDPIWKYRMKRKANPEVERWNDEILGAVFGLNGAE